MPGPKAKPRLRINVLGDVTLHACVNGTLIPLNISNRKARAIVAILAIHDQRTLSRELLTNLLWGAKEQSKAQGNLRNALYEVRRALAPHGLAGFMNEDLDRHMITIDHSLADVDVGEIFGDLSRKRVHDLLLDHERVFDALFDDLKRVDNELETWVVAKRTALARRALDRAEDLMRTKTAHKKTRELAARAVSNLDPSNEEAVRVRMLRLAQKGDSGSALTLFVQLSEYLDEQLGSEPSLPTIELNAAIKLGNVAVTEGDEEKQAFEHMLRLSPGERLVLGVCSFDTSGISEAARPYVDGFRGDLVSSLAQFREWDIHEPKVIWSPAMWPRGRNGDYIIEARAIEADGEIRLTLTLHDLETMRAVDAEQIHLSRDNWFSSQDAVIRKIARWLNVSISDERIKAFGRATADHPALAYDIWVKYDQRKHLMTPEQWREAEKALTKLVAEYPEFARGYASLASSYNTKHFIFPGVFKDRVLHEQALELSQIAIRLDPLGASGHRAAAYSYALLDQFDLAEHHFRLVLELNENDVWSSISASAGIGLCGKWNEAAEKLDKLMALTAHPTPDMIAYHAYNFFGSGNYAKVVKMEQQVAKMSFARAMSIAAKVIIGDLATAAADRAKMYSELRKRWASNGPSGDAEITRWLVQMSAISCPEVRKALQDGLETACQ